MEDIHEIKKILKKWELKFVQENQRKPTKTDIASASDDIQDAYSKYSSLKKQNESVLNVDTWSDSLNRSTKKSKSVDPEKKKTASSSNYLDKLGAKLFQNSKSLVPNPKNLLKKFSSKNNIENSDVSNVDCEQSPKSPVKSQSVDKGLFEKALALTQSKGVKSVINDAFEPFIPQPFQQQQRSAFMQKKYQRLSSFNSFPEGTENTDAKLRDTNCYLNDDDNEKSSEKDVVWKNEELEFQDEFSPLKVTKNKKSDSSKNDHQNSPRSIKSKSNLVPHSLMNFDPTAPTNSFDFDDELEAEMELSNPVNKNKDNFTEQKSRTSKKRRKIIDDDDKDEDEDGDIQASKRSKTEMSTSNSTNTDQPEVCMDVDESVTIKPSAARNVASSKPMKTDNFVRLNMRTKGYKRKGKGMTGAQHKRLLWKNKMAARSSSRGDTCFKCGEAGHWANKCPNKGNSKKPHKMNFGPTKKGKSTEANQDGTEEEEEATFDLEMDLDIESGVIPTTFDAPTAPPPMEPLVCPNEDGSLPDMDELVYDGLKKFGFDSFRKGQEKSVKRMLCGLSTLVVLSTGAGKSLCYQLPAYLYAQRSKCITLVISPLISLMEDQIAGLPKGVNGACFHSNMTKVQREKVMTALNEGELHFLLISPETIAGGGGGFSHGNTINPAKLPPVAFVCIDEAHCLSEWSHHFRPSYLRLCKVLREKFGVTCFLGLTATATLSTAADVSRHLNITKFEEATIRGQPVPDNLKLSVSRDEDRDDALIHLLQGERMSKCASIIIYCTRRDQTDRLATLIRTCLKDSRLDKDVIKEFAAENKQQVKAKSKVKKKADNLTWDAESYHAGHTASHRRRVQNSFMSGRLRVVVATVAFGMGLDKSDVRAVIHYNMPKSFESYVQEIGRAGRDGKPAHCHVFLDQQGHDLCELRKHTFANTIDRFTIKKLLQKVFHKCRCAEIQERAKQGVKDCEFPEDGVDYSQVSEVTTLGTTQKDSNATGDSHSIESENLDTVQKNGEESCGSHENKERAPGIRICPGHERAIPIEPSVMELDVKEEGLATLMCYLELRPDNLVENLPPVYATCKLQCYGGPLQLQAVAKKCPPVSVAIARLKREGAVDKMTKELEFNVIELADSMGWDSGPVKRELKLLQWNMSGTGSASKSGVMVELTDLAFHIRAPGDLSDEERDTILDELNHRVQRQEKTELRQLQQLHTALTSVSHKAYWMCSDEVDLKRDRKLKVIIDSYFEDQTPPGEQMLQEVEEPEVDSGTLCQLQSDVRSFINMYSTDHVLNARAVARILQGIPSPCFPAIVWGRVRAYWRSYLHVDFNIVMNAARKCLIQMRT